MEQVLTVTTGDVIKWVIALAGGIVTLLAAINAIGRIFTPYREIKKSVETHDRLLKKDNDRITNGEESSKHQCRALLALIDHELTGNGVERLRDAKDDLQKFLTER